MAEEAPPPASSTDPAVALVHALNQISSQCAQLTALTQQLTDFVANLNARVRGTEAVAAVVDNNQAQVQLDRQVAAGKELISHFYEKSQQYVTIVVAGAYAAYFTTLSTVSERFSNNELRLSALLMTMSLTLFVIWEVINLAYVGWYSLRGELKTNVPNWYKATWPVVIAACLLTALPAVGFSMYTYTYGLIHPQPRPSAVAQPSQISSVSRP